MDALSVINQLGNGDFLEELAAQLANMGQIVASTGKAGAVTVTLKVKPAGKNSPAVLVEDTIKSNPPKTEGNGAMFFAIGGELLREDPRQIKMEFREVERPASAVRTVTADAAPLREVAD